MRSNEVDRELTIIGWLVFNRKLKARNSQIIKEKVMLFETRKLHAEREREREECTSGEDQLGLGFVLGI